MKKETITGFMLKEHGILRDLLATFRSYSDRDLKRAEDVFKKFKEKHENHIFLEEKGIFNFNREINKMDLLNIIIVQHRSMEKMMAAIWKDFDNEEDPTPDVIILQTLMRKHLDLEEKGFYPKLDKQITDQERKKILKKI